MVDADANGWCYGWSMIMMIFSPIPSLGRTPARVATRRIVLEPDIIDMDIVMDMETIDMDIEEILEADIVIV